MQNIHISKYAQPSIAEYISSQLLTIILAKHGHQGEADHKF